MENKLNQPFDFGDGKGTTREYRSWYRDANPPRWYSGWMHLVFTSGVTVGGIVFCLTQIRHMSHLEWLTVPVTLLYANFAEYIGHRGPMHRRLRFLETIFLHTTIHHRFFTHDKFTWDQSKDFHALLLPPYILAFFFGLFALPVGIVLHTYVSSNVAYLFVASAVGYFTTYEWLHFCYHSPETSWIARLPLLAQLRRLHLIHHNPQLMTRYNFNITLPLFDRLFGTLFRANKMPQRGEEPVLPLELSSAK